MFSLLLVVLIIGNFYAAYSGYKQGLIIAEDMLVERLMEKHNLLSKELEHRVIHNKHIFVEETLYQFFREGQLVTQSDNALNEAWLAPQSGLGFLAFKGHRWRSYSHPTNGGELLVAERYDTYINVLERLLVSAVTPLIWMIPIVAIAILLIIKIGFKPLATMASLLEKRSDTDFSSIHIERPTRELSVVIQSLNQLLSKLGAAFDREQRFASYAAHELRSPITSMKLSLHNLGLSAELRQNSSFQALEQNVDRMQNTIDQLLLLAKIGDEQALIKREKIPLHDLAANLIGELYNRLERRQQTIELLGEEFFIFGNRFALEGAIHNLIDNAIKYTPVGGDIKVEIKQQSQNVLIKIEDSGPGIPEADRQRVFERFYRVGADRHSSGVKGTGLGLSIVAQCLHAHAGKVELSESRELGGLCVCLCLPVGEAI